jgi:hypothetical protein
VALDQAQARRRMRWVYETCTTPEHLRSTVRIALVVGLILTLINQADVILGGDATEFTWIKVGLNFCVPFVVSNLGLLAGKSGEGDVSR